MKEAAGKSLHETQKDKENTMRGNEDPKGKGGRLKHYNVDGDVPLCLRKTKEKGKDGISNKKNNEEKIKAEAVH